MYNKKVINTLTQLKGTRVDTTHTTKVIIHSKENA